MAKQAAAVEVNAFVKGLVTEASPMTFPDNASLDELNLVLNKDGSRKRRFGMDLESGYTVINSTQNLTASVSLNSFSWKSPGGFSNREFAVVQFGTQLNFFDSYQLPISRNLLKQVYLSNDPTSVVSITSVDGVLVVVNGDGVVYVFTFDGTNINQDSGRLKIRDLFGVEDKIDGSDLLAGSGLSIRPVNTTNAHLYNLRNQTFAIPRFRGTGPGAETLFDCITSFRTTSGKYPSNSDNVISYLYSNPNDLDDRTTKRYFQDDNINNPIGTHRAPVGYFIIDAFNRGSSRLSEYQIMMTTYPTNTVNITSLPTDQTPGGANVVSAYAGRVWFSGFSSQLNGGDSQSPRMGSYVLFSRLVQSNADIYKCYQEGDPTSSELPDLVDTDGGFIRLDGAYNIQRLINVGDSLMVIAENGVWRVTGGSGYGFKATDYLTSKITEHGSISPNSVVLVDNTIMYWSDDGIYHVTKNQYGDWAANNLTTTSIQTYYDKIASLSKKFAIGIYDSYLRQVRWLYNNQIDASTKSMELILDLNLGAFYPAQIPPLTGSQYPRVMGVLRAPPYQLVTKNRELINSSGELISSNDGSSVTVSGTVLDSSLSEIYYIVATGISNGGVNYTFAIYNDVEFLDWKSIDGVGVDAGGFLLTGWTGMGDFQRQKQVPYITVYSRKTETGFSTEYVPLNSSSIILQSQWNWTNSAESGKWGNPFQCYRHKRLWTPEFQSSGFDDGESVVVTRNKLRGRGRVLSLRFSTEPKKYFNLVGWSFIATVNGSV